MLDLLTIGRISVDLYGEDEGHGLADPQHFQKSVGGSPTNVAIGTARYGHSTAIATGVGNDALGNFIISELKKFKVGTEFVIRGEGKTPIVVAGIKDPDNPEFVFYRDKQAPDTQLHVNSELLSAAKSAKYFWFTGSTLSQEPLASTVKTLLKERSNDVIFDLDYRPVFWATESDAHREINAALRSASIAIGNLEECAVATGLERGLPANAYADALLALGISLAIVKGGANGVLVAHSNSRVEIPGLRVKTKCGLGAGDAFGAAVVHGLLSGWSPEETVKFANAAGAYVASQLMCSDAMPTESQVRALLS
jgi:5-dehydro-2-deoxygluconokinase